MDSPVPTTYFTIGVLGLQIHASPHLVKMDFQNPNVSPHGCVVGILHNELSLQPLIRVFDLEGGVIWSCLFYVTLPVRFFFQDSYLSLSSSYCHFQHSPVSCVRYFLFLLVHTKLFRNLVSAESPNNSILMCH